MTSPAHPTTGNRRRTIAVAVAAAVVIAVVVAVVVAAFVLGRSSGTKPQPAAATTATTAPSTPATSGQTPLSVNGCLGGPDATLAIGSVFNAPLTPAGAVEFTATLSRWLGDSTKDGAQYDQIAPKLMSADLVKRYKTIAPGGHTTSLSTATSAYKVSGFTPQKVTVEMSSVVTITDGGGLQRGQYGAGPFTLTAKGGHWILSAVPAPGQEGAPGAQRALDEFRLSATPLVGGCG